MWVSSADQAVLVAGPSLALLALPLIVSLTWARINSLSPICENFVENGYRVGSAPEERTMREFWVRLGCWLVGQTIASLHGALIYCDSQTKQAVFTVVAVVWALPLYLAASFLGFLFIQLLHTLALYFQQLRSDLVYKNHSLGPGQAGPQYDKLVRLGGLPKRLDRLIDECRHLQIVFGPVLYYEFLLYLTLLSVSLYLGLASLMNAARAGGLGAAPPWWVVGHLLLATHHYLRLSMFCQAGEALARQLERALALLSQFAYVHNDTPLLGLAVARRPALAAISVAGYAPLTRSSLSSIACFMAVVILGVANFKMMEK